MRLVSILLLILLLVLQCGFYFVALLYQPGISWILVPLATVAFYFYAARQPLVLKPSVLVASAMIGLLLAWPMLAGAISFSNRESFPWLSSLLWGVAYFVLSSALCLGGAALLRRVLARSS
mgnify:FL=1